MICFKTLIRNKQEKILKAKIDNLVSDDKIISIWHQGNLIYWMFLEGNSSKTIPLGQVKDPHQIIVKEEARR